MSNENITTQNPRKRAFNEGRRHFKKSKKQKIDTTLILGSNEEVISRDVCQLLEKLNVKNDVIEKKAEEDEEKLPEPFTEVEVEIIELSSTGDGLALLPGTERIVIVPFTVPGDKVIAKVIRHDREQPFSVADFVKVTTPSLQRDDSLVKCPYFSKCSGCQFQMLTYEDQLAHKKSIVEKAFRNFSGLHSDQIPFVLDTMGSPKQYGYRTKLTPHFDGPPGGRRDRREGNKPTWDGVPNIGFMLKGTRRTMDIEDCPIGTDAVRNGLKRERKRVIANLDAYARGATLLCREHTTQLPTAHESISSFESDPDVIIETTSPDIKHVKSCITDPKATSTEYVLNKRFDNPAGSFFQNNNSILSPFLTYIQSNILSANSVSNPHDIINLVDAYSGSGLFTISLSALFQNAIGIDISAQSIESATLNAELNGIPKTKARFLAGDAVDIFAQVRTEKFEPDRTVVVIDPSRKGCDEGFLKQLRLFRPRRIVYVSCNVHTQARDVGVLCKDGAITTDEEGDVTLARYEIESLRGFDFFPQTAHVEGVAFLTRVE